ncbi:MAG: Flp family type IVb pilin [Peptococcaceae bacterium]|nr:Flp family type IVb pilin [Peptococcaceae bacterium]
MWQKVKNILRKTKGQGMAEYALILVMVAVVVYAALGPLGDSIKSGGETVGQVIETKINELQSQ